MPYWIDKNEKAIRLAKINNPEFEKNFLVGDYFNTNLDFSKFSTISLHFNFKYSVTKIVKLIEYIYNNCIINTKIIIYNSDTFTKKNLILNKKLIKSLLSQKYYFLHFHENFIILNKN